jgi:hypothetical protein
VFEPTATRVGNFLKHVLVNISCTKGSDSDENQSKKQSEGQGVNAIQQERRNGIAQVDRSGASTRLAKE